MARFGGARGAVLLTALTSAHGLDALLDLLEAWKNDDTVRVGTTVSKCGASVLMLACFAVQPVKQVSATSLEYSCSVL